MFDILLTNSFYELNKPTSNSNFISLKIKTIFVDKNIILWTKWPKQYGVEVNGYFIAKKLIWIFLII